MDEARVHTRRTVLRSAVWAAPVIATTAAAPAFASSTEVTVSASRSPNYFGFLDWDLTITFSDGAVNYSAIIVSVTYSGGSVSMSPTTVSSMGGTSSGSLGSLFDPGARSYTITYQYNRTTRVVVRSA